MTLQELVGYTQNYSDMAEIHAWISAVSGFRGTTLSTVLNDISRASGFAIGSEAITRQQERWMNNAILNIVGLPIPRSTLEEDDEDYYDNRDDD